MHELLNLEKYPNHFVIFLSKLLYKNIVYIDYNNNAKSAFEYYNAFYVNKIRNKLKRIFMVHIFGIKLFQHAAGSESLCFYTRSRQLSQKLLNFHSATAEFYLSNGRI